MRKAARALSLPKKQAMEQIHRDEALAAMDNKEKPFFSISFYLKNGEVRILPKARQCGLKYSMKDNRMRGVRDANGNDTGHTIPVSIDNIRTFNGKKVKL